MRTHRSMTVGWSDDFICIIALINHMLCTLLSLRKCYQGQSVDLQDLLVVSTQHLEHGPAIHVPHYPATGKIRMAASM